MSRQAAPCGTLTPRRETHDLYSRPEPRARPTENEPTSEAAHQDAGCTLLLHALSASAGQKQWQASRTRRLTFHYGRSRSESVQLAGH